MKERDEERDEERDDERDEERDEDPCHTCDRQEFCDGWEAQFCCTLCRYYNDDPDCEYCDPMDI